MRTAYRIIALLVAAGVAVQAMSMVFAVSGLRRWVADGGVLDRAAAESRDLEFTGADGFMVHALNGSVVLPLVALALLVCSFFARIPGGVARAALVLVLVGVQATLGFLSHELVGLGALHGLNALLLLGAAVHAAQRARAAAAAAAVEPVPVTV